MNNFEEWLRAAEEQTNAGSVEGYPKPLGADEKKKKKKIYDGRTREGRKFVERIMARRKAAEATKQEVKEATTSFKPLSNGDIAPVLNALKKNVSVELKDPNNSKLIVTMQTTDKGVEVKYKKGPNSTVETEKRIMSAIKAAKKFLKAKELVYREV